MIDYLRARGLRGVLEGLTRRFLYRDDRRYITERRLDEPIPEVFPLDGVALRQATAQDVEALHAAIVENGWWRRRSELSEWIRRGYPFSVAIGDGRLLGYACVAFEPTCRDALLRRAVRLKDGDAWGADAFVIRQVRGRGLYTALGACVLKRARELGYRRVLSSVPADDLAVRSAHRKTGVREIREIAMFRLLFYTRVSISELPGGEG